MPGHLTSFKVGGHFGAKGSSLNDRGAGARLRRFNYASESPRSGTWSHHRHTESCKPNKTKQNKTSVSPCDATDVNGDASFRWEIGVRGVLDQWGEAGIYGGRWLYPYLLLSSGRGGPLLFRYIG